MSSSFVHVHNHTEYSLLDGANRIPELVARAAKLEQPALAISDHGVMFGAMEFYMECQKKGVKPIIGMEAYVAPNGLLNKTGREENQTFHLLLLAKDLEGYRNLCKLHTVAALQGFYYKPRIDHQLLQEHAKGLIGTSACLGSEICQFLMKGQYEEAQKRAGFYKEIFDEGSFFIELQDHGLREQREIKDSLVRISKELKLPLIATNDAHYLCKESNAAHDVLLCIGTGALLSDEKRLKFQTEEFYLKSTEEMTELFSDTPEAIENSLQIMDMCNVELGKRRAPMPQPEVPDGMDTKAFLRELAEKGLKERVEKLDESAFERLNYELSVIEKTNFDDYFLLVREFAQFARNQGIAFGVRGSAAGSLVSFCIGITDVDPLKYDLTFERFLNPERISMPDVDMDFEDARRGEVIEYVTQRFGADRVAQIVTFGTLGAKAAIKDAGRVMGYAPIETDKICKTIPNLPGMNIDRAMKESHDFRQMVEMDPRVRHLVDVAKDVEGTARHCGVHAAGVVIAGEPLSDYIPLYRSNEGTPVTAFEMGILEKLGMLKMDFLGLSNLTVLAKTAAHIKETTGQSIVPQELPLDDKDTYELLSRGDTVGVFQLESSGMRRNILELKPQSVQEVCAMVALYRPGPMDHIPTFIDQKFGRKPIEYLDPCMEPILRETYGVIVYQDQVLKLVQAMAGFTLGKADILRRAMGKKDVQAMNDMQVEFMAGAAERGISKEAASKTWEMLLPFAGYAFNKAHAACYALLAYQTAYLKAHYPVQYMTALLAVYRSKEDRVTAFIEECRHQRITVLPPDINASFVDFSVEEIKNGKKKVLGIRFGLAAIKGVGEGVVEAIIKERAEKPFEHLYEFADRLKPHGMNRTALEALAKAGALESIDKNRKKLVTYIDAALAFADQSYKNRIAGQDSLFDAPDEENPEQSSYPALPETEPMSRSEVLAAEKEVMGIYVSDHPLRGLEKTLTTAASHSCSQLEELDENVQVKLAGVVAGLTVRTTKTGDRMATLVLEDFTGQAQCTIFPKTYNRLRDILEKDKVVQLKGVTTHRERPGSGGEKSIEIRVDDLSMLEMMKEVKLGEHDQEKGILHVRIRRATRAQLEALTRVVKENPGDFRCLLQVGDPTEYTPIELTTRVNPTRRMLGLVEQTVPECNCEIILNPFDPLAALPEEPAVSA